MLDIEQLNAPQNVLRVAVVSETWPPEINGVAITMHRLALELQRRGHAIQVIRPRQGAKAGQAGKMAATGFEEMLTLGLPIPNYPHLRMGLPAKRLLTNLWQKQRPDLVHVATEGPLGWSAVQAARKLKIPTSSDFRTNFHSYGQHYGIGRFTRAILAYLRKFHNLTDFTTVPTDKLKGELQAMGFERLKVVSRGVDTERFSPAHRSEDLRRRWGASAQSRVYLYVGRLAAEKNPELLAAAWREIACRDASAQLVLVGDGPASQLYRQLMPAAIYAGSQSGDALAAHYASADIFLFPSVTETYGNVVPEAMASGLMGLTFNYAASTELVRHDFNGWVADYGDADQYQALAGKLSELPLTRLNAMCAQARQTMLTRGWDAVSAQVEGLWRQELLGPLADSPASFTQAVPMRP
ncbi:MAG: glycosyltransferase family 1 protein [Burkholderiaceae bacterium]|nr:glycosyltransferase family 1 protein [Burkholderiaceae bacterium]MCD8515776.1 glycosyltransferase family 1 protein [Burkholderiaceae bacterium]MCD8565468.1 glycosyltransferase family 1 protein [Burkholderiaceae bacterium]